jgi:hypothetical protein
MDYHTVGRAAVGGRKLTIGERRVVGDRPAQRRRHVGMWPAEFGKMLKLLVYRFR